MSKPISQYAYMTYCKHICRSMDDGQDQDMTQVFHGTRKTTFTNPPKMLNCWKNFIIENWRIFLPCHVSQVVVAYSLSLIDYQDIVLSTWFGLWCIKVWDNIIPTSPQNEVLDPTAKWKHPSKTLVSMFSLISLWSIVLKTHKLPNCWNCWFCHNSKVDPKT